MQAEKTALRLIARAEQNSNGLRRKLEKRGYESACITEVINRLIENNLINDFRFACLWLESRLRLTRSPRQLLFSLRSRGIEQDDAQNALKKVLDDEIEFSLLERFVIKAARKKNSQIDDKRLLKSLLKNEGFSFEVIRRFLNEE